MTQSNAFLWTRGAAQTARQSNAFLWTRGAAQTARQSNAFLWERGAPIPDPLRALGPGVDGFIQTSLDHNLGPGIDGFILEIPSHGLGPGVDGLILIAVPVYGGTTGGQVAPLEPLQGFGGLSGSRIEVLEPVQGFGGVTGERAIVAAANAYGGSTEAPARFGPVFGWGGITGGVVFFLGLPPAIRLTAVGVAPYTIELAWMEVGAGQTGFRIERSLNGQGAWEDIGTTPGDVLIFLDLNTIPLVVYDYRVIAFSPIEDAQPSNVAMAFSPPPGGPPPPESTPRQPPLLEFLSPGIYGLERDPDGNVGGNKF